MGKTKDVAVTLAKGTEIHFNGCTKTIGPKGGVRYNIVRYRVSGKCKTWVKSPERFRLPISHGMYIHGYIGDGWGRPEEYHLAADCPLNKKLSVHVYEGGTAVTNFDLKEKGIYEKAIAEYNNSDIFMSDDIMFPDLNNSETTLCLHDKGRFKREGAMSSFWEIFDRIRKEENKVAKK